MMTRTEIEEKIATAKRAVSAFEDEKREFELHIEYWRGYLEALNVVLEGHSKAEEQETMPISKAFHVTDPKNFID